MYSLLFILMYTLVRAKAVDYAIGTSDAWNYAIDLSTPPKFVNTPSAKWSSKFPFDTANYPYFIEVQAKRIPTWSYWQKSKITGNLPTSPVDCASAKCGETTTLKLVPFGGTNIRISVFPWFKSKR